MLSRRRRPVDAAVRVGRCRRCDAFSASSRDRQLAKEEEEVAFLSEEKMMRANGRFGKAFVMTSKKQKQKP